MPASQESNSKAFKKRKKLALGKGLDALIPDTDMMDSMELSSESKPFFECDIDLIQPNRYQPRVHFAADELTQLSESIKTQGILQPILVRRHEIGYELVAGERRLRAAKLAGFKQVPVVVKDISDAEMLEMSIVENIQRENLNPIEEAEAYHRLMEEFGLTQDQAAGRVGKSRSAVANYLRLRQLPEPIKTSIFDGQISMGHARALLGAATPSQQNAAWRAVVQKGLSVRQTEVLIKRLKNAPQPAKMIGNSSEDRHIASVADNLSHRFGTKVQIKRRGKKGRVEIEFYSNEDLDRLLAILNEIE